MPNVSDFNFNTGGLGNSREDLANTRMYGQQYQAPYGYAGQQVGQGQGDGSMAGTLAMLAPMLGSYFNQGQPEQVSQPGVLGQMASGMYNSVTSPTDWAEAISRKDIQDGNDFNMVSEVFDPAYSNPLVNGPRSYKGMYDTFVDPDATFGQKATMAGMGAAQAMTDVPAVYNLARSGNRAKGLAQLFGKDLGESAKLLSTMRNTNLGTGAGLGKSLGAMARQTFTTNGNFSMSRSLANLANKIPGIGSVASKGLKYVPGLGVAVGVGADAYDMYNGQRSYLTSGTGARMLEGAASDAASIVSSGGLMAPWVLARNAWLASKGIYDTNKAYNNINEAQRGGLDRLNKQKNNFTTADQNNSLYELSKNTKGGDFDSYLNSADANQSAAIDSLMSVINNPATSVQARNRARLTLSQTALANDPSARPADFENAYNARKGITRSWRGDHTMEQEAAMDLASQNGEAYDTNTPGPVATPQPPVGTSPAPITPPQTPAPPESLPAAPIEPVKPPTPLPPGPKPLDPEPIPPAPPAGAV